VSPTLFAQLATRYWQTYRPSALAQIPAPDRPRFFADLGQQVSDQVEELIDQIMSESPSTSEATARSRAEDLVLDELIYLPKEPGTENREIPRAGR
jgi:hypothetical protein